uniref:hypothetical protein n=1 Tax=Klebsiella michiganensis TaxID=1134687 RepID=UPI000668A25C
WCWFISAVLWGSLSALAGFFVFTNDSSSCIANIATRQKDEALRSINDCSAVNHEDDNYSPFEA